MAGPSIPEGFDFTDPDLYVERVPTGEFAELRRTAPVWLNSASRSRFAAARFMPGIPTVSLAPNCGTRSRARAWG